MGLIDSLNTEIKSTKKFATVKNIALARTGNVGLH